MLRMALQAPKKSAAGFFLALTPPTASPKLQWDASSNWTVTGEWSTWAARQRAALLETLLSNPKWFSKPPRREVLDPLFHAWDSKTPQGAPVFLCPPPEAPEPRCCGTAAWQLEGLMMSSKAITPVWTLCQIVKDEVVEAISLFDDGLTVDSSDSDNDETREIHLEEVEEAGPAEAPAAPPTRIRSREWETKKFMAKERVREARMKAQIAARMAESEETRFFRIFGDLDDAESNFSDYDISPSSSDGEAE